jgi:hypothetical protein
MRKLSIFQYVTLSIKLRICIIHAYVLQSSWSLSQIPNNTIYRFKENPKEINVSTLHTSWEFFDYPSSNSWKSRP